MSTSYELPAVPLSQRVGIAMTAVVLGLSLAASAVVMLSQESLLLRLAGLLLLVADALAVGYLLRFVARPRGKPVVHERGGATVLPESSWARVTAWGTVAASLGFLAVVLLAGWAGSTSGTSVGALAAAVVLLLALPTGLGVLHRRIRPGELVLTPAEVRLRSWNADRALAWDDVSEVALLTKPRRTLAVYAAGPERIRLGRRPAGIGEQQARSIRDADRALAVSIPHLTGDPAVLASALEHWRSTPSDRSELGTPAALARLLRRSGTG